MFDHVTIRVSDRAASERFYATVLRALGIEASAGTDELAEWHDFSLAPANAARPVARGLHIGFAAPSRAYVDELNHDRPELTQVRAGDETSFSVLAGTPAEHVQLAFRHQDDATVEAFHRAATAAGY
jgi:catechol 2,3-dioxygenase-like lactoylglutathione lyase family enzyme